MKNMAELKKGDKVVLHPPGSLDPAHNPLMGKRAVIVDNIQKVDNLEWYEIELSGGIMIKAPAKWLRKKTE